MRSRGGWYTCRGCHIGEKALEVFYKRVAVSLPKPCYPNVSAREQIEPKSGYEKAP